MLPRALPHIAIAFLVLACASARADEVKGIALVKVEDPQQGSIPELVRGTGSVEARTVKNESFQRDGQVSNIMVEVGDRFKKGDPLLDFGASPAAVVAYDQAKTALRLAESTLARTQSMFKLKLMTTDDVDNAEKAVSDAQLTKEMFEKIGSIKPSEILEAPFDGMVKSIAVSKGDRITAGTTLMTLAQTDRLRLTVGIEPSDFEKVKPGQEIDLASPLPGRAPFKSKVRGVGAAIDPQTRLVPVFVDVPATSALPGEDVNAQIIVGEFKGWLVPRDAVGYGSKGPFVFQVDEDHAKRALVNVVGSDGDTMVVGGDIDPKLKLVTWGNYQIDDGDPVRTQPQGEAQNQPIRND
jgi:membrane fusion protein (multidrug efflux system)